MLQSVIFKYFSWGLSRRKRFQCSLFFFKMGSKCQRIENQNWIKKTNYLISSFLICLCATTAADVTVNINGERKQTEMKAIPRPMTCFSHVRPLWTSPKLDCRELFTVMLYDEIYVDWVHIIIWGQWKHHIWCKCC